MNTRLFSWCAALAGLTLLFGCGSQPSGGAAQQAPTSAADSSSTSPAATQGPHKPTITSFSPPGKGTPVPPGDFAAEVVWKHDTLIVTAYGSSTCRPVAEEAVIVNEHTIIVSFGGRPKGVACTDDYTATRSRIPAPSGDINLNGDVYAIFDLEGAPRQPIPVELIDPILN